jgi:hypothetical protein
MTSHMYQVDGLTDIDKTRESARYRSIWGFGTSGPNRPTAVQSVVVHFHEHRVVKDVPFAQYIACQGFKHEIYKDGMLIGEVSESGKIHSIAG